MISFLANNTKEVNNNRNKTVYPWIKQPCLNNMHSSLARHQVYQSTKNHHRHNIWQDSECRNNMMVKNKHLSDVQAGKSLMGVRR